MKDAAACLSQSTARRLGAVRSGVMGARSVALPRRAAVPCRKRSLAGGTWQLRVHSLRAWVPAPAGRKISVPFGARTQGIPTRSRRFAGPIFDGTSRTCSRNPQDLTYRRRFCGQRWASRRMSSYRRANSTHGLFRFYGPSGWHIATSLITEVTCAASSDTSKLRA